MASPLYRSARPDDALELAVSVQPEHSTVTPDSALLEPAERRLMVALHGVDADVATSQLTCHSVATDGVGGPDIVIEPEGGAVGDGDRLVLVVERLDDDDRTEELLLRDPPAVLHAGEQRRRHVEPRVELRAGAARDELRTVLPAAREKLLHPVPLQLGDDRAHDG